MKFRIEGSHIEIGFGNFLFEIGWYPRKNWILFEIIILEAIMVKKLWISFIVLEVTLFKFSVGLSYND